MHVHELSIRAASRCRNHGRRRWPSGAQVVPVSWSKTKGGLGWVCASARNRTGVRSFLLRNGVRPAKPAAKRGANYQGSRCGEDNQSLERMRASLPQVCYAVGRSCAVWERVQARNLLRASDWWIETRVADSLGKGQCLRWACS